MGSKLLGIIVQANQDNTTAGQIEEVSCQHPSSINRQK